MKKIILVAVTIITMMICIAQPLFVHAADVIPVHEYTEIEEIGTEEIPANIQSRLMGLQYMLNSNAYEENSYFFYTVYKKTNGSSERYYEIFYTFSEATVSYENGYLDINYAVNPTGKSTNEKIYFYNKGSSASGYDDYKTGSTYTHVEMRWGDTISINFYDRNGNNYSPRMGTSGDVANGFCTFITNIPEIQPQSLNVLVDFSPDLVGNVDRESIIDGKKYISESLELTVTNNGADAQWAMFIVPHDSDVYVPTESSAMETFQYSGKCTFAYVTNEWQTYDSAGEAVGAIWGHDVSAPSDYFQSPSVWHAIPHGEFRTYSISWNSMSLDKGVFYDVVVYASLNDQLEDSGTSSMMNGNPRPAYTVTLNVSAQEIYRSSFHILNPAEFNPDSVDSNGTISWNPLTDNDDIFKGTTAYKDSHGNLVIDNSSYSPIIGNGINGAYNSNSKGFASLNGMFSSFFSFINSALSAFPSVFLTIITAGFTGLVIIGIVKVAIK